jgi:hypothetical protein
MAKGVFKDKEKTAEGRLVDFSYHPNDSLAQMIVDAWTDDHFKHMLLDPKNARSMLAQRGVYLEKTAVITEAQYAQGYTLEHPDQIIFVLPRQPGTCPPGQNLLETARLLMACTPHGI